MANRRKIGSPDHYRSGATAGTFGSATQAPVLTVDSEGHVTASSQVTISGVAPAGAAGGDLAGTYPNPTLGPVAGDVTAGDALDNDVTMAGSATGLPVTMTAAGVDADIDVNLVPKGAGGVQINGGTPIVTIVGMQIAIAPAAVAANTTAEEAFATFAGLTTADVVTLNGPAPTPGTGIVGCRVSAANTLAITFANNTAGPLTPTAGTYVVSALRF